MHPRPLFRPLLALLLTAAFFTAVPPNSAGAQTKRGPFTAEPRSVRSRDFDQQHVRLELRLDWDRRSVQGRAVLTLSPYRPLRQVELDAAKMTIRKVAVVEPGTKQTLRELKFQRTANGLTIALDREYQPTESLQIAVDYQVEKPQDGLHFVVPDGREAGQTKMAWTQSEPEYAHYWFPCVDTPADRLASEILTTVPAEFFVLSNGVLKSKQDNADGTRTWHWVQEKTHVPYLMSIVAGDFEALEQSWDGIPVVSYVPRGRLEQAPRSFEKTPAMLKFFSEKIGTRYPWEKYTQICVDEYMWGGMEHTSCTTLNLNTLHDEAAHLDVSSDNLVAHELAHQWFGDLLTCKDWGEIWLNESFATYFAVLWTEHDLGPDEGVWARHLEAESYNKEDRDRYRRPIVSYRYLQPVNVFDRHAYPKGGRVLHMLRYELGDDLFWRAIRHYCTQNAFQTVETADFRTAIERSTGQGLNWFFDQWLYHGGHPDFDVRWHWDEQAKLVQLTVRQVQKLDDLTPLFRSSVEIELTTPSATLRRQVTVSKAEETFHFELPERPQRVEFDPQDWILKSLRFEKGKEELLDSLAHSSHVMCRVRAVQGLAAFRADADAVEALARTARTDAFWGVRQEAVKTLGKCSGEAAREALVRAAVEDAKSFVRREACKSLEHFPHDDSRAALRQVIAKDQSYYAVADALTVLAKIDLQAGRGDLLAAMERISDKEVILKAACDGLAERDDADEIARLVKILNDSTQPLRRTAVMEALARLGHGGPEITKNLANQLSDSRPYVRAAAIKALGLTGDSGAVPILLAHREKEEYLGTLNDLDDAVKKLRGDGQNLDSLRKQLQTLRQEYDRLQERLKKLESAPGN